MINFENIKLISVSLAPNIASSSSVNICIPSKYTSFISDNLDAFKILIFIFDTVDLIVNDPLSAGV